MGYEVGMTSVTRINSTINTNHLKDFSPMRIAIPITIKVTNIVTPSNTNTSAIIIN